MSSANSIHTNFCLVAFLVDNKLQVTVLFLLSIWQS